MLTSSLMFYGKIPKHNHHFSKGKGAPMDVQGREAQTKLDGCRWSGRVGSEFSSFIANFLNE